MSIYTSTFDGMPIQPANISYEALTLTQAVTQLEWQLPYQQTSLPVANYISVTSNNNTYKLQLPDATLVSVGQAIIFSNVGSNTFTVTNFSGGEIVANIAAGIAYYVILSDNTTSAGTWVFIQLGAGTSSASASALAGYGLIALLGKLNTNIPVTTISTPYTVNPVSDRASMFIWTGGTAAFTLPVSGASAGQAPNGFYVSINNETTVSGVVSVTPSGGQLIDGIPIFTINPNESSVFVSNGTGWNSLGYGNNANISIGVNNLTSTGGTVNLTDSQSSRQIQNISGTLASNLSVNATSIPQQYYVTNSTTGSFTLSFNMQGGVRTNLVPQGTTMQFYCDGTDMYPTPTNTVGQAHFNNGTAATPSISFVSNPLTGTYYDPADILCTTINGTQTLGASTTTFNMISILPTINGISLFSLNQCYD